MSRRAYVLFALGAWLLACELNEVDQLHSEGVRQVRQSLPGQILSSALYPRDGDRVKVRLGGKGFDAQSAAFANAADRGSKLGKGRLRHGGSPASRSGVDWAITYMLVCRNPRKRVARMQGMR